MEQWIKNSAIFGALSILAVILVMSITAGTNGLSSVTGDSVQNSPSSGVQNVKLRYSTYGYILEPSELKMNVPVRMEVDMSTVYGCMRSIVIPAFNVRKTVSESDNIIEFTPDKAGTFNIVCSMNMGRGKFTVVSEDGSKSNFVEKDSASVPGVCGGSQGCGCGAR